MFHFVDAKPQQAHEIAREEAGGLDVRLSGGPTVVRDFLAVGILDTLRVVMCRSSSAAAYVSKTDAEGLEERYDIEAAASPSGVAHLTFTRR